MKPVIIGSAELWLGDCREVLPLLSRVDAVITDPPYSARTHAGHDSGSSSIGRAELGYQFMTPDEAVALSAEYSRICDGWTVWMTDHTLAPTISQSLADTGRYVFAPLPFFQPGRSVRITGDGPNSWTDWIIVSRTKGQVKWGTLPGGYVAGPGWKDKERMGGKPTQLMRALVSDYSRAGQTVLDTHMGSGTTGVAAVEGGRKFIGCEVDPAAFEIACRRIEKAVSQGQLFGTTLPQQEQASLL